MSLVRARVTAAALDPIGLEAAVRRSTAGATVLFTGVVRDHDDGRDVAGLDYEAHPDAQEILAVLLAEWLAARPEVLAVGAEHRFGELEIGQVAFCAAVAAAHRAEAFAACAEVVDLVKQSLPVWKHQRFTDGTSLWVGSA